MLKDSILILDFGSQTTHLIGRRLRDLGAKIIILNPETPLAQIRKLNPAGIILSGGPSSVYLNNSPTVDPQIFTLKIPVLGICYGWQLMAEILGGKVSPCQKEYGPENLTLINESPLFDHLPKQFKVWVSHGDTVIKLPKKFGAIAKTENVALAAAADSSGKLYGVQFHPEVEHTRYGSEILKNFLTLICHYKLARKTQITRQTVSKINEDIKNKIGDGKAVCAVSGGVDSTVAACLAAKAIGSNLIPIHIANGLMRRGTDREVQEIFRTLKAKPIIINAERLFLKNLRGLLIIEKKEKLSATFTLNSLRPRLRKLRGLDFLFRERFTRILLKAGEQNTQATSGTITTLVACQIRCILNLLNPCGITIKMKLEKSAVF